MTEQKSFKRLVRARMEKTGESYTAARAQLLAGDEPAGDEQPVLAISDDAIRDRTGRGWEAWFDLLDQWGAAERPHKEIARWVARQLVTEPLGWNAQAITVSYERARLGRAVGQRADGFAISASKTVATPVGGALRRVRRRGHPQALAARRRVARADGRQAEVRPLRLGGETRVHVRRSSPRARPRAPSLCRMSACPTPVRRSG